MSKNGKKGSWFKPNFWTLAYLDEATRPRGKEAAGHVRGLPCGCGRDGGRVRASYLSDLAASDACLDHVAAAIRGTP